ncbi:hypothetical protein H6776_01025 [Candidatus Nomurabacteria bacterium]|nr:hypothetical protein [Candidatus Nomurabacteria bacterium]
MPQNFQTTFIPQGAPAGAPKGSTTPAAAGSVKVRQTVSILTVIATLCVLVALVSIAGVFILRKSLEQRIVHMESQLETAEKQFEPSLIATLKQLDERLNQASGVLRSHRSIAPFFHSLNDMTLKSIQYDSIDFEFTDEGLGTVAIEGQARSYQAIAQQSVKFADSRMIQDHIFSEFELQDTGRVKFGLLIILSPEGLLFEKNTQQSIPASENTGAQTGGTSTASSLSDNPFVTQ